MKSTSEDSLLDKKHRKKSIGIYCAILLEGHELFFF